MDVTPDHDHLFQLHRIALASSPDQVILTSRAIQNLQEILDSLESTLELLVQRLLSPERPRPRHMTYGYDAQRRREKEVFVEALLTQIAPRLIGLGGLVHHRVATIIAENSGGIRFDVGGLREESATGRV